MEERFKWLAKQMPKMRWVSAKNSFLKRDFGSCVELAPLIWEQCVSWFTLLLAYYA